MHFHSASLKSRLTHNPTLFTLAASLAAFICYSCMYGFRKPFTVGNYSEILFLGIPYKVCLVIAQVIGYMISKIVGIKFISSLPSKNRAVIIIICILIAWLSLLFFAITPAPYNLVFIFINGLPLGLLFGLVFSFLEGRKTTEILAAFLVSSFIFASGFAKTVGKFILLNFSFHENWMPFLAGAFYIVPLCISVYILHNLPAPNATDITQRSVRDTMSKLDRRNFLKLFKWMIIPIVIVYTVLTISRDFIEDFANEFWIENGYQNIASVFTNISILVSILILIVFAASFLIKKNKTALSYLYVLIFVGLSFMCIATLLFTFHHISAFYWMLFTSTGLYMAYLPFNGLFFDRFIAVFKIKANVGFIMYVADSFGYLGTVLLLLLKSFFHFTFTWTHFLTGLIFIASIFCLLFIVYAYFKTILKFKML
jgi:hypothetical protein